MILTKYFKNATLDNLANWFGWVNPVPVKNKKKI